MHSVQILDPGGQEQSRAASSVLGTATALERVRTAKIEGHCREEVELHFRFQVSDDPRGFPAPSHTKTGGSADDSQNAHQS
jgi:hypothetical protein